MVRPAADRSRGGPSPGATWTSAAGIALLLIGIGLRVAWLGSAVVLGDEIHAIRVALEHDLPYVLTHFHAQDNCIPLTAWARLLARSIGLEEWGLRAFALVPGVALVVGVWIPARRYLDPFAAVLAAGSIAVSPALVYWAREARPYSLVAAIGAATAVAFFRLLDPDGRRRTAWTATLALGHAVGAWTSPTYLPWCATLIGLAGVAALGAERPRRARLLRRLLAPQLLGLLVGAGLIALALDSFLEVIGGKAADYERDPRLWVDVAAAAHGFRTGMSGAARWLVAAPLALGAWGAWSLARTHARAPRPRAFVLLALASLALVPFGAYVAIRFHMANEPRVLLRYVAASVPLHLFLVAAGLGHATRLVRGPRARLATGSLVALVVLLQTLTGPYASARFGPGSFGLEHSRLIHPFDLEERLDPREIPPIYREPEYRGRTFVVWPTLDELVQHAAYQLVHRGPLVRFEPRLPRAGARFRTLITGRNQLRERSPPGALWVVHRDVQLERAFFFDDEQRLRQLGWRGLRPHANPGKLLLAELGPPVFDDGWTVAFDPQAPPPSLPLVPCHVDELTDARIVQARLPGSLEPEDLLRGLARAPDVSITCVTPVPDRIALALRVPGHEGPTEAWRRRGAERRNRSGVVTLFGDERPLAARPRAPGLTLVRPAEGRAGDPLLLVLWGRRDMAPARMPAAVERCLREIRVAGGDALERLTTSLVELDGRLAMHD